MAVMSDLILDGLRITQGAFRLQADLRVTAGERVAIIGPSGAGKSTLLGAIAGSVRPDAGRIVMGGQDITGLAPGARPLSILFQDGNLFPHLDVWRNLGLGISPDLRLTAADRDAITEVLDRVGLADKARRRPAALSGGEQSRVALARALLRRRPLLLLDEPFAALGPALKVQMLDLVAGIATGTGATVLMVTHDPDDARHLCPRTILVADGRAHPPADTRALLDAPPEALRRYLGG